MNSMNFISLFFRGYPRLNYIHSTSYNNKKIYMCVKTLNVPKNTAGRGILGFLIDHPSVFKSQILCYNKIYTCASICLDLSSPNF